ncbi:MAG TPA: heat-inducible transcription repressor HrcA [Acidimicrobiaceae bacterium]|nr:heat-inducible transcription repressor HrcA [Acidimicrobiaceae bacterium]
MPRARSTSPTPRDHSPGASPGDPGAAGDSAADATSAHAEQDLDHRKAAILKAVVAEYIESAQPVGSGHVTGSPGIEVSSATVRADMASLEREGYLTQPHTSAGRIPTDKGYRFFVDHIGRQGSLGPDQRQQVRQFFRHVHGEFEDLLGRTSGLLADLTDYAGVVVAPTHDTATVRSVQLVDLGNLLALLVVVLSDGSVEKRTVELPEGIDDVMLVSVANHLTSALRGRTLAEAGAQLEVAGDDEMLRRAAATLTEMAGPEEHEHVFVGGSSRMAAAFDAMDTVRSVLSILEQQLVVVELIEQILDRGLSVAIGTEHGFEPLASCALVVSSLAIEGEPAGTIGVVGPTRMNYPRALAAVRVVGEQLSERLGGAGGGRGSDSGAGGARTGGGRGGR